MAERDPQRLQLLIVAPLDGPPAAFLGALRQHKVQITAVSDTVEALQARIVAATGRKPAAILVFGGNGLRASGAALQALQAVQDLPLPGFEELFRVAEYQEYGPAAMLLRAGAGLVSGTPVFVLPPSGPGAALAWNHLIEPNLGAAIDLASGTSKPPPPRPVAAPTAVVRPASSGRVTVEPISAEVTLTPERTDEDLPPTGWMAGLAKLGAQLEAGTWPVMPEGLRRRAPVQQILDTAGERGLVDGPTGRWVAFGFPDLRRARSKVLLVADGHPDLHIIALHRFPAKVGAPVEADPYLTPAEADPRVESLARTGAPAPRQGRIFAVQPGTIFLQDGGKVWRWDGRNERDMGTPAQALASLVLRWSQR